MLVLCHTCTQTDIKTKDISGEMLCDKIVNVQVD